MSKIDHSQTRWFCGTLGNAGIVGTIDEETGERRLYVGGGPAVSGNAEAADERSIADWGCALTERQLKTMVGWLQRCNCAVGYANGMTSDGCSTPHTPAYCEGCPRCPTRLRGDEAHDYGLTEKPNANP